MVEPPLSDKCKMAIDEAEQIMEKGGCIPKERVKSLVMCEAKRLRQSEGAEFSESMKGGWALARQVRCEK